RAAVGAAAGWAGFAAGWAGLAAAAGFASIFGAGSGRSFTGSGAPPTRFERPSRCTLPMTALRVTPPSSLAIWLADWPSAHIFFSVSTRSSVQDMLFLGLSGPSLGPPWRGVRVVRNSGWRHS